MPNTLDSHQPQAKAKEAAEVLETNNEDQAHHSREETILVVDGDKFVRDVVGAMFEGLGYRTIINGSAMDALATLEHEMVDLVLSDLCLADGMSGLEFAARARRRHPGLKFIFMSGYPENDGSHDFALARNEVILSRPFDNEQLSEAVRTALG